MESSSSQFPRWLLDLRPVGHTALVADTKGPRFSCLASGQIAQSSYVPLEPATNLISASRDKASHQLGDGTRFSMEGVYLTSYWCMEARLRRRDAPLFLQSGKIWTIPTYPYARPAAQKYKAQQQGSFCRQLPTGVRFGGGCTTNLAGCKG